MLSGYRCGPRRVPGVVKPANPIPLLQHDFSAPYKDAASQHAYVLLSCYNISTAELWLRNLLPAGELPRGGIPRTHSKTGSREQKVQRKLHAPASSAAVSLSALPLPQAFASNAFGSYSLIHFTKCSLPCFPPPCQLSSSAALLSCSLSFLPCRCLLRSLFPMRALDPKHKSVPHVAAPHHGFLSFCSLGCFVMQSIWDSAVVRCD